MDAKNVWMLVSALTLALVSCVKEEQIHPYRDAEVYVTVYNSDGKALPDVEVRLYDETAGSILERDPFAIPSDVVMTSEGGTARYVFPVAEWFSGAKQRFVTFAVLRGSRDSYSLRAVGRTVSAGETLRIDLRLD